MARIEEEVEDVWRSIIHSGLYLVFGSFLGTLGFLHYNNTAKMFI